MNRNIFIAGAAAALCSCGAAEAQGNSVRRAEPPLSTRPPAAITLRPSAELGSLPPAAGEGRVEVNILGGGKVRFLGMTCSTTATAVARTCARDTKLNAAVQLVAEPLDGYRFAGWARGCASSNAQKQCTLTVADSLVVASAAFVKNYGPLVTLSLRYEVPPMQGLHITLKPDTALDCVALGGGDRPGWGKAYDCTAQFDQGTTVAIKAEDWFVGGSPIDPKRWGGACKGASSTTCTLKVDQPQAVSIAIYQ